MDPILKRKREWIGKGEVATVLEDTVAGERRRGKKEIKLIGDVKRRVYIRS